MKTQPRSRADVCTLGYRLKDRKIIGFSEILIGLNTLFQVEKLSLIKPEHAPLAWDVLALFAETNCPQVLYRFEGNELLRNEITFLRERWQLRMDEPAPEYVPEKL